jgi:O-antigen chain-terminating methyltransferase
MTAPEVDVEALIEDLRREAAEMRRTLGPSALPPEEDRATALRAIAGARLEAPGGTTDGAPGVRLLEANRLATLGALADPGDVEFRSHRASLGRGIVAAKRLLRRLLTPILDRQAAYNRAVVQSFVALEEEVARRLDVLERQLGQLERRLLVAEEALAAKPERDLATPVSFDYGAFEDAFRGSREHVRSQLARYLDYFASPSEGPVVDLGCGRGEFLELLAGAGVAAWGVEQDERRVAEARAGGLDVRHGDVLDALEGLGDGSLGGVVSFQMVEHLPLAKTVRLLAVARRKLRPGGCLIVETVNVQSLITHARGWSIDPSHRQPLHPLTLRFLVEQAGFARCELVYGGEVEDEARLESAGDDAAERRNVARLNALLFAPQDYAVVAWA